MSTSANTHPLPQDVMAYADGELTAEPRQALSTHLLECQECGRIAAELREVSAALRNWKPEDVPDRVEEAVLREAQESLNKRGQNKWNLRWKWTNWKLWAVGATAVGCVVFLLLGRTERMDTRLGLKAKAIKPVSQETFAGPASQTEKNYEQAREQYQQALELKQREQLSASLARPSEELYTADEQNANPPPATLSPIATPQPMIARTVSVSVVVKDFAASRANLDAILRRHHGYAAELTANTAEGAPRTIEASLRIPAAEQDSATADLKALGRVEKESQSGEEVTQQHADLVARLKNARETEQRLQIILVQRTGKISDVLQVEQEIARVRGEIEEMEAEQKSLEHRVEFASVNLSLTEEYKAQFATPQISAGTRLHNALVTGFRNASETLLGMVLFFAEYALTLAIWGVILLGPVILLWRRFRRALATV